MVKGLVPMLDGRYTCIYWLLLFQTRKGCAWTEDGNVSQIHNYKNGNNNKD